MEEKKKILAVASIGGHWVQLLRIVKPLQTNYDVVYVSTHEKCATLVNGLKFHVITDFSRWNLWKAIPASFKVLWMLVKERPSVVLTTGAAPGLLVILFAKFLFIKTIWIDSIANASELSGSGKLALYVADHVYTQWPDLAKGKVKYAGNVFGT